MRTFFEHNNSNINHSSHTGGYYGVDKINDWIKEGLCWMNHGTVTTLNHLYKFAYQVVLEH